MKRNKNVKYIPNSGYAFNAEDDMKKLSELADEGWVLTGFKRKYYYYKLERGHPEAVIYNIDMYKGDKADLEDYFETFRLAGWEVVEACKIEKEKKQGDCRIYVFKAPIGTVPIYTDTEALKAVFSLERDEWLQYLMKNLGLTALFTVMFIVLSLLLNEGIMRSIVLLTASIVAFAFYCISTTYATGLVGFWIKAKEGEFNVSKKTGILMTMLSLVLTAGVGAFVGGFIISPFLIDMMVYFGLR